MPPKPTDNSIHGYHEKYHRVLYQLFPDKFPRPIPKREGVSKQIEPFQINLINKKVLYDLYLFQEASDQTGVARRWTLLRLLSKISLLLEETDGFSGDLPERTFQNMLSHEKGKEIVLQLANKVRRQTQWNRTTENFHLRALKQLLRHMNGGDSTPHCISWLKFKRKKNDSGEDPSKAPKLIKREDIITEPEMAKLYENASHTMIKCALACLWEGLRASELLNLRKKSVTFEENTVNLSVQGKTGSRIVKSATGARYIRDWLSQHPDPSPDSWLFVIVSNKNKGQRYGYFPLGKEIHNTLRRAGIIKRGNLHVFRHSRVVDMLLKGYSPAIIQKVMGWSSLDMLQTYGHLVDVDAHNEVLRIELGGKPREAKPSILSARVCLICSKENDLSADSCVRCSNALTDKGLVEKNREYHELKDKVQELQESMSLLTAWMKRFGKSEPSPREAKEFHDEWIKTIE
ncbi:MAG: site-specific integrase [Candidatus Diapherotrites archaeon]|nr:site-specific integrase [Candidatus Diapherotrites archaeon]